MYPREVMRRLVWCWSVSSFLVACGPVVPVGEGATGTGSSSGVDPGTVTGHGSVDDASTVGASTAEVSTGADVSGTGSSDTASSTTGECTTICVLDFPCHGMEQACVDASTIEVFVTVWCEDAEECAGACGCWGGKCEARDPEPCPEGTWCVDQYHPTLDDAGAACLSPRGLCGGPDGLVCGDDELCEYAGGLCPACVDEPAGCGPGSPLGICVPRPTLDAVCPELDRDGTPLDPQCGCDGITYLSECHRRREGVASSYPGECR